MKTFFVLCWVLASLLLVGNAAPVSRVLSIGEDFNVAESAFSPDGRFLAARTHNSDYGSALRQTFRLFNAEDGQPLTAWRLRRLQKFAIAPNGRTLAIITGERLREGTGVPFLAVEVRDLLTGALRRSLVKAGTVNAAFYSLAWSPDGKLIAAGSGDGRVIIWNAGSGQKVAELRAGGAVGALAWSPRHKLLALSNERGVQLWDWNQRKRVAWSGASNSVGASLQFLPDGKRLLSNDNYRFLRLLEVPALAQLTKKGYSMSTFSRDGKRIAFYHDFDFGRDLIVTDATMKRQVFRLRLVDWQVKALDLTLNHQLRWVSMDGADDSERKTLKLWRTSVG